MTKAKKDLIAWIIWLVVGAMLIAGGGVGVSVTKGNRIAWLVCGNLMMACGVAIMVISIIQLIKINKVYKHKNKAH